LEGGQNTFLGGNCPPGPSWLRSCFGNWKYLKLFFLLAA